MRGQHQNHRRKPEVESPAPSQDMPCCLHTAREAVRRQHGCASLKRPPHQASLRPLHTIPITSSETEGQPSSSPLSVLLLFAANRCDGITSKPFPFKQANGLTVLLKDSLIGAYVCHLKSIGYKRGGQTAWHESAFRHSKGKAARHHRPDLF